LVNTSDARSALVTVAAKARTTERCTVNDVLPASRILVALGVNDGDKIGMQCAKAE
jgi:hypothetical protein